MYSGVAIKLPRIPLLRLVAPVSEISRELLLCDRGVQASYALGTNVKATLKASADVMIQARNPFVTVVRQLSH
jgi:hypothetical protein